MNVIELKAYYPAGGKTSEPINITQVKGVNNDVYTGYAILPMSQEEQKIIIYALILENGLIDYRAIPARCPHQGADLTNDTLKSDGNVYCSLHRRPICVYSEYNQAYSVIKHKDGFLLYVS